MNAIDLKPCPFCGTAPEIDVFEGDTSEVVIYCPKCGAQTDEDGECITTASDKWNARIDAVALLTDEPSKTAEDLYDQLDGIRSEYGYDMAGCPLSTRDREMSAIQSALTAHAKAKVEEAADRFCKVCPILENRESQCNPCGWRAAILGREVEL